MKLYFTVSSYEKHQLLQQILDDGHLNIPFKCLIRMLLIVATPK